MEFTLQKCIVEVTCVDRIDMINVPLFCYLLIRINTLVVKSTFLVTLTIAYYFIVLNMLIYPFIKQYYVSKLHLLLHVDSTRYIVNISHLLLKLLFLYVAYYE